MNIFGSWLIDRRAPPSIRAAALLMYIASLFLAASWFSPSTPGGVAWRALMALLMFLLCSRLAHLLGRMDSAAYWLFVSASPFTLVGAVSAFIVLREDIVAEVMNPDQDIFLLLGLLLFMCSTLVLGLRCTIRTIRTLRKEPLGKNSGVT